MERIQDSGSNYQFYEHQIDANPPRSLFDLSYIHTTSVRIGGLYPVYVQWTLPNSDYTINISDVIRSLPMTVPLMSRLRVFFHFYYAPWVYLWKNAKTFVDKGYDRKTELEMPYIDLANTHEESLWRYFGLPQFQSSTIVDGELVIPEKQDVSALHVSALPFMMYQSVYKYYYLDTNKQFDENGDFTVGWYPNNEDDFRINETDVAIHEIEPVEDLTAIDLTELRYRDFAPDYFTSALPKPINGDPIGISLAGNLPVQSMVATALGENGQPVLKSGNVMQHSIGTTNGSTITGVRNAIGFQQGNNYYPINQSDSVDPGYMFTPDNKNPLFVSLANISSVTLDQLRLLNANQIEMEKAARTDGSYNAFMRAFFGDATNYDEIRPIYIGGSYQPIIVSDIVQTSSTVETESQTSVQGNQTGKGFSSDENANIGHIHSKDFGLIMGIMSILPDTYYAQGVDRDWTVVHQSDLYLPERAGLSMQEIKQKEIFASRTDNEANEKIWAYIDRFDEKRYRQNIVTGYVGDKNRKEFAPYIQTRWFDSAPTYSQSFATTKDNIDYEQWFAKKLEPPFISQMYFQCRAVEPMPYRGVPQGLFGL